MHERSLVQSLLRQVERVRTEHHGDAVDEVAVEVGPLSGVEPLLLREAFTALAPGTRAAGARLIVQEVPLVARCQGCGESNNIRNFTFRCPACGGEELAVTQGDALRLLHVTLRQALEP
jgi:hydrogenase nickel incorporation protein HypA/HybF